MCRYRQAGSTGKQRRSLWIQSRSSLVLLTRASVRQETKGRVFLKAAKGSHGEKAQSGDKDRIVFDTF